MFELGRELKRFFSAERTRAPSDGLTRGDTSLLELLDARLLAQEAKASDIAAGRVGAKDKPARRLEADEPVALAGEGAHHGRRCHRAILP